MCFCCLPYDVKSYSVLSIVFIEHIHIFILYVLFFWCRMSFCLILYVFQRSFKHFKKYVEIPCFHASMQNHLSTKSLPGQYENPSRPAWSQKCSLVHDVDTRSHERFQFHHRWYPTVCSLLAHCLEKGYPEIRKRCQNWRFFEMWYFE